MIPNSISQLNLKNKKALLRVDFNVPLNKDGTISDTLRISESIPTIKHILKMGGSVILLSHLGRPKGEKNSKYSLKPCQKTLSKLLDQEVLFSNDCLGMETEEKIQNLKPGEVILLENLRFYGAEENPALDTSFAKKLSSYGDVYINDAFAACHREHSSISCLPKLFPHLSAAGFLLEKEIKALSLLSNNPPKPFHAIIGGAKISSKLGVIRCLLEKVDTLYIGGAMAFTFFKAQGLSIGNSLFEPDLIPIASDLIKTCLEKKIQLCLPKDIVIANSFTNPTSKKIVNISKEGIDTGWYGMDVGPETLTTWQELLSNAASIFWNGPVGVFEQADFAKGTFELVEFLASLNSYRVIGGGDSAAAVGETGLKNKFTHISTGGGASLEFLENGTLPGVEALNI
jgi:phosphoglycerate kinase